MPISVSHPIVSSTLCTSYPLPSIPEGHAQDFHPQPASPKMAPIRTDQQPTDLSLIASDGPSSSSLEGTTRSEGTTISFTTPNHKHGNYKSTKSTTKRMVIFDWDDTLFPTTYTITNETQLSLTELHSFGAKVYKLLMKYIDTFGGDNIYIITNGGDGWIQYSLNETSSKFQALLNGSSSDKDTVATTPKMKDYFKSILAIFKIYRIRTISARHLYGHQYPGETTRWKELAFAYYSYHHFYSDGLKDNNIVMTIGDSCDEWIASKDTLYYLQRQAYDNMIPVAFNLQRIKLKEKPTLSYLMKEWDVIIKMADNKRYDSFDDNNQEFEHVPAQTDNSVKIKRRNRNLRIRAISNIYK